MRHLSNHVLIVTDQKKKKILVTPTAFLTNYPII